MDTPVFFAEVVDREEAIKELKEELKLMVETFAAENNLTIKGIQKGLKEYKEWLKDRSAFNAADRDADIIFESLMKNDG